jgi:carboxyl-terminal processing protease
MSQQKKYKTLKGRTVYAGGGILPDVFVPLDTSKFTKVYQEINARGLVSEFVYGKLTNSIKTGQFKTLANFKNNYQFTDNDYNSFLNYCTAKKVEVDKAQAQISKPLLINQIKALLARYYFGEEGFYAIYSIDDAFINVALDKLKNPA